MAISKLNRLILHLFHEYIFNNKQRCFGQNTGLSWTGLTKGACLSLSQKRLFGLSSPSPTCSVIGSALERPILTGQLVIKKSSNKIVINNKKKIMFSYLIINRKIGK